MAGGVRLLLGVASKNHKSAPIAFRSLSTSSRAIVAPLSPSRPPLYNCLRSCRVSPVCISTQASSLPPSRARCKSTMADSSSANILSRALENNKKWASDFASSSPTFFSESSKSQKPKILWLGCADSRVPESLILGLEPGQIFTHRNIANIITSSDLSAQSIIEFAVGAIGVEQIIVCGHTNCGGVAGALGNAPIGAIDVWLTPLRMLRERLVREGKFEGKSAGEQNLLLVEENVKEGVRVVRSNPHVLKAAKDREVTVHGFVYELHSGLLRQLDTQEEDSHVKARSEAHDTDATGTLEH